MADDECGLLCAGKPVADLATAIDSANLTIVGYDATWQMWRDEYVRKCKHSVSDM